MSKEATIVQGGRKVRVVIHDCGTVCHYKQKFAELPYPPYLLVELWCPTCKETVSPPEEP